MIVVHSHSWVWAVLPPECRRIRVIGDPALSAVLQASGFELVPPDDHHGVPEAVLLTTSSSASEEFRQGEQFLVGSSLAAVVLQVQGPTLGGRSRLVRGVEELASAPGALALRRESTRVSGALRRAGLNTEVVATGARERAYVIGPGSWRRLRRFPVGAIVVGTRGPRPLSTLERAVTAASSATGEQLRRISVLVLESGKVLQELENPSGRRFMQRVGGGPAALAIARSADALQAIAGAAPPPAVLDRLMLPVCAGEIGLARFTVEPKASGAPAADMTDQLWNDCLEFLVALHELGRDGRCMGDESSWAPYEETLELLARHVSPEQRPKLEALGSRLRKELSDVEVGWGHGDVSAKNLLADNGRLTAVLDWDGATPEALPLLDLLDLLPAPDGRTYPGGHPGTRMTSVLWPLMSSGEDPHLRAYCDASSITRDRLHLEAFAAAYWLDRVSRSLRPLAKPRAQPVWVRRNLEEPLSFLAAQGWA